MSNGDFVITLIQTVGLLTPSLILFYNQGKYRGKTDQILTEHSKDINGIGQKVSEITKTQDVSMNELKAQIDNVSNTLAKVTTSIQYIEKHIDELRRKE
jgi:septal ring factor EnvC (AmiA/AmiB activator)